MIKRILVGFMILCVFGSFYGASAIAYEEESNRGPQYVSNEFYLWITRSAYKTFISTMAELLGDPLPPDFTLEEQPALTSEYLVQKVSASDGQRFIEIPRPHYEAWFETLAGSVNIRWPDEVNWIGWDDPSLEDYLHQGIGLEDKAFGDSTAVGFSEASHSSVEDLYLEAKYDVGLDSYRDFLAETAEQLPTPLPPDFSIDKQPVFQGEYLIQAVTADGEIIVLEIPRDTYEAWFRSEFAKAGHTWPDDTWKHEVNWDRPRIDFADGTLYHWIAIDNQLPF